MSDASWIIPLHFLLVWGSVLISMASQWRMPLPFGLAAGLGFTMWLVAMALNTMRVNRFRTGAIRLSYRQRESSRILARTLMNLAISILFRSWLTLIVAFCLVPLYIHASRVRERFLHYLRTGIWDQALPGRTHRHWGLSGRRPGGR